ncbi:MAG: hypothetical protein V4611_00160 [Patescibacteria group bacterium]
MGLYVKQSDTRSQLQEKLAAELQEKARAKAKEAERPDGVEDSAYIEGTKKTTTLAFVWLIIGLVAVGLTIWLLIVAASHPPAN